METVLVQIKNPSCMTFLENLESLNVLKVLRGIPVIESDSVSVLPKDLPGNPSRLSEIRAITQNIHIDLTNFKFNRDEANNYDE